MKNKANIISDLYRMSFKVKGGENLRRACLMCLNTKQANAMDITPELIESLPEEKQEKLKFDVLVAHLDQVKNDVTSTVRENVDIVKNYIVEKGLFNGKNIVSAKLKKPVNIIQKAIVQILNTFVNRKDIYSLFRFTSQLIAAKTPEEIASLTKVSLLEVRDILKQESLMNKQIEKSIDLTESSNEAFLFLDNTKFFAVNGLFALSKVILVKVFLFGAPVVGVLLHLMPMIGSILLMAILTDVDTTANLVKKFGIATTVIPAVLIARLIPHLKLAYNKISDVLKDLSLNISKGYDWAKNKTLSLFDRKQEVLSEAIKLASYNPVFYRMLEERL